MATAVVVDLVASSVGGMSVDTEEEYLDPGVSTGDMSRLSDDREVSSPGSKTSSGGASDDDDRSGGEVGSISICASTGRGIRGRMGAGGANFGAERYVI